MSAAAKAPAGRSANAQRERSRRAAREPRPGHPFYTAALGLLLVGVILAHVWLRLQVVKIGYVLSTASKLQSRLEQENRELKIELATLTSPERLESLARRRLGLVSPEKGQVIVLP